MHTFKCENLYGNGAAGLAAEPLSEGGKIKLDQTKIAQVRASRERVNALLGA